ncbi:acyl-CoA dehydrogenase family protein [Acanthopleuribacter pedis]|uniref:Acyl-CoA dehydrogenase family protein n=1 Tax=Acanthopleuribacter pedis TaxID=442870 RepID=A0A8J7QGX8_9BACT|nr:acyl-CoA dehydrogenase family protein [Acanthopleuribacter pedis]MBO1320141.1 acyl-CoA dehydrogenase family protein [Acanthopleuribacter pedis]
MVYFSSSHDLLRDLVRRFVHEDILPYVDTWEQEGLFPRDLYRKAGSLGILGVGFGERYGGSDTDLFHTIVVSEELTACGAQGIPAGLGSHMIACPPLLMGASEELKQKVLPPVLTGEAVAALAITEPNAGSDVAGIQTRAISDGDHYRVNGAKTFITSGTRADFYTTAVRTGGEGRKGVSLLLIERDTPGFKVAAPLKKMGWRCSDTAELSFEDCRVPKSNLIGAENEGFQLIMQNFLAERLQLAVMAYATADLALKDALAYARTRQAFGAPLTANQVIRHKLVDMQSKIDVARAYVYHTAALIEAGQIALQQAAIAKNQAVEICSFVVDQAVQIFGGLGYMEGVRVERLYRDARLLPIGGGTQEIMKEIIWKTMDRG